MPISLSPEGGLYLGGNSRPPGGGVFEGLFAQIKRRSIVRFGRWKYQEGFWVLFLCFLHAWVVICTSWFVCWLSIGQTFGVERAHRSRFLLFFEKGAMLWKLGWKVVYPPEYCFCSRNKCFKIIPNMEKVIHGSMISEWSQACVCVVFFPIWSSRCALPRVQIICIWCVKTATRRLVDAE